MLLSQDLQLIAQADNGREGYCALRALSSATGATHDASVWIGDMRHVIHGVDSPMAELHARSTRVALLRVYGRKPLYLLSRYPVITLFELAKSLAPELLELRPHRIVILFLH